jgi:signal transduction histidine kinase
MEAFARIDLPVLVLKIDGGHAAHAILGEAAHKAQSTNHQMDIMGSLLEASKLFNVVTTSTSAAAVLGTLPQATGPGLVMKLISHKKVATGIKILKGFMSEPVSSVIEICGSLAFDGIDLRILGRETVADCCYILFSPNKSKESKVESHAPEKYKTAIDESVELFMTVTLDGKMDIVNQGLAEIMQANPIEKSMDVAECFTPEALEIFSQAAKSFAKVTKPWYGRLEFTNADRTGVVFADCRISPVFGAEKHEMVGYCVSGYRTDGENFLSNHLKPMKLALSQSQKFSMIGKMAGNIIHEINNPITVINGNAEKINWLMDKKDDQNSAETVEGVRKCADKILKMTERVKRIIAGMKNVARGNDGEDFAVMSLSQLTEEVHGLLEVICQKSGLSIEVTAVDPTLTIRMQYLSLSQVLVNLLNNGLDAVKNDPKGWLAVRVEVDLDWVYIKVVDSGAGIQEEVKARLFENYFTTKGLGQGAGIGLALSLDIVRRHGGDLFLDQMADNTTFVVKLPRKAGLNPRHNG